MLKRFLHGFVLLAFLTGLLAVTPVRPVHAATLTVNTLVDENDSSCLDSDCSLRDALEVAASGDTINFSVTGTINLTSLLVIGKNITISGPGSANLTLYQTTPNNNVIWLNNGWSVSISGIKIQNGQSNGYGGGIYNAGSSLALDDIVFQDNVGNLSGGGIYNIDGVPSLTITNSSFVNNTTSANSAAGGAIFAYGNTTINLTNVEFSTNSSYYGGALALYYSSPNSGVVTLDDITVAANTAYSEGGGLYLDGMNVTMTDSVINGNSAAQDGGAVTVGHPANYIFKNVTISGNQTTDASGGGGAIAIWNSATLILNNATIVNNSAGTAGGGGLYHAGGTINMSNTILANNSATAGAPDCFANIASGDYNLVESTSGCTLPGGATHNITGTDPLLNPLADNGGPTLTHSLQVGSPALDAGDDATCESTDQRGVSRPQGADCEIGAFEDEHPTVVSIVPANPNPTALTSVDFTVTFSENVTGVVSSDFTLAPSGVTGVSITNLSGANDTYTVTVDTGLGNGTLGLNFVDVDGITDDMGNLLGGPGMGNGDLTGEVYVISKTAPALISPANGAFLKTRRPAFDWSNYAGAKGYQIQVSKGGGFGTTLINVTLNGATNSKYTPTTDLPANTLLYWRVRAKLSSLTYGAWSPKFTFTTGNPPSIPTLVSPANGKLLTNLSPTLDWSDSTVPAGTTFDHYQVQLDDNLDFSSPYLNDNTGVSTYNILILNPNTKYYWRVRAWNTNGDYSSWSLVRSFREAMTAPLLISPIGGGTVGSLKPLFDWSDVTGATGYTIQVSLSNTFNSFAINVTINTPTSQYVHSMNLQAGKLYYWRVRANGPNGPSLWSTVETFMTP